MQPLSLSGDAFVGLVEIGDLTERALEAGTPLLLVSGDALADDLPEELIGRLATLPAVVVALVGRAETRRPRWADVVLDPDSPALAELVDTVSTCPLAATTLAVLLRTGEHRGIAEGLVAESTTYGLLQGGGEFARWRQERPRRVRPAPPGPPVLVSRTDGTLWISLNRPHVLNAFDAGMRDGLLAALDVALLDPTVTAVELCGNGDAFCSGGDLDEFGTRPDPVTAHTVRLQRNAARSMADLSARTTAHIHGATVGSGIELAAFAGRVEAASSTRISLPEVRLGLIPGAGGTVSLPRRIGRHRTMLLALGLRSIDADTALDWGLVDGVGE
jgi:hypothetical protein